MYVDHFAAGARDFKDGKIGVAFRDMDACRRLRRGRAGMMQRARPADA